MSSFKPQKFRVTSVYTEKVSALVTHFVCDNSFQWTILSTGENRIGIAFTCIQTFTIKYFICLYLLYSYLHPKRAEAALSALVTDH